MMCRKNSGACFVFRNIFIQEYNIRIFFMPTFFFVFFCCRGWVAECMSRPYEIRYDAFTQSIEILDSADKLDRAVMQLQLEVNYLRNAVSHMKFR